MVKVSVIVPTYRSGDGLRRLVRSLDKQSMPTDEFEVLLIDDGSPDDTYALACELAATRPTYRALAIEHSGWPSAPRNRGIAEASGEYVLFMDHDDELYPHALRAAYDFGTRHRADVVNPKEIRTKRRRWGLEHFAADLGEAGPGSLPVNPLMPMTPHKLYRRSFLVEHQVRFPEEPRHLWEDIFFNIDLLRHSPRVAVLSSTPFYHWRHTGENSSTDDYQDDPARYWPFLDRLFAHVDTLGDVGLREELHLHNVRTRVVSQWGKGYAGLDAEQAEVVREESLRLLATYLPEELAARLPARDRLAVTLARAGRMDAAHALLDPQPVESRVELDRLAWTDGALQLAGRVTWTPAPPATAHPDGSWSATLPPVVEQALAELDVPAPTTPPDTGFDLIVQRYPTLTTWRLEGDSWLEPAGGNGGDAVTEPVVGFRAILDPRSSAAGGPVPNGMWELWGSTWWETQRSTRRIRAALPSVAALINGRPVLTRVGRSGVVKVDIGQRKRSLLKAVTLDWPGARVRRRGWTLHFTVPLPGVAAWGETTIEGRLDVQPVSRLQRRFERLTRRPASGSVRLVGDAGGARLEGTVTGVVGAVRGRIHVGGPKTRHAVRLVGGLRPSVSRSRAR